MSKPKKTLVEGLKVEEGRNQQFFICGKCGNGPIVEKDIHCEICAPYAPSTIPQACLDAIAKYCNFNTLKEGAAYLRELEALAAQHLKREQEPATQRTEFPWAIETMRLIDVLTPDTKGKAFDPDWFFLRQRLEEFEAAQPPQELVSLAAKWRKGLVASDHGDMKMHGGQWVVALCADELEAALTRGEAPELVVLASRCMRHRNIPPMNRVCADGAECPICAQHNPPEPLFPIDAGGNSTLTRLDAEIECNRDKPDHALVKDSSVTHGDLRALRAALTRGAVGQAVKEPK